jgi:hypothetical protein
MPWMACLLVTFFASGNHTRDAMSMPIDCDAPHRAEPIKKTKIEP